MRLALGTTTLAAFIPPIFAAQEATAIRKVAPDSNEKILAHHLAFAPLQALTPGDAAAAAHAFLNAQSAEGVQSPTTRYRPAFALHHDDSESNILQRAAVALSMLQRRSSCPAGMTGCDAIGAPNKCCQQGTHCVSVQDSTVGGVACCPSGSDCRGNVGKCPPDAVSCPAQLGGGCCIPGYICQGEGCVPSASAKPTTETRTVIQSTANPTEHETITRTTIVAGSPTTVIVTQVVTRTESPKPETKTTTQYVTDKGTTTDGGGVAPWRPISGSTTETSEPQQPTQSGCPTGFYGCLATHGGGCCRTDRNCHTSSCPPQASKTITSNGVTLVVPETDVPANPTATCAGGWFLCGPDAGPVAGCCPSGYECGTASCFTRGPTQTGVVQKHLPGSGVGGRVVIPCKLAILGLLMAMAL